MRFPSRPACWQTDTPVWFSSTWLARKPARLSQKAPSNGLEPLRLRPDLHDRAARPGAPTGTTGASPDGWSGDPDLFCLGRDPRLWLGGGGGWS
jgi:hypothetical protein